MVLAKILGLWSYKLRVRVVMEASYYMRVLLHLSPFSFTSVFYMESGKHLRAWQQLADYGLS